MSQPPVLLDTEKTYHLTCKIVVKDVSFEDYQSKGRFQNKRKMVFLVPVENSQKNAFLAAWLPEVSKSENPDKIAAGHLYEHNEVVMELGHPMNAPARGAVMQRNDRCDDHHIFLMSFGLSQIILGQPALWDREISVEIHPESADSVGDYAHKGDDLLPFEKKGYSEREEESPRGTG